MTDILPFYGITYNKSKIKDYGLVLTQPYDKITPEMQAMYYKRNPYNLVRITKGKDLKGDNDSNNKYTRAADYLNAWLKKNILVQDNKRAIYAYHEEFHSPIKNKSACGAEAPWRPYGAHAPEIRKGFIGLMRLVEFGQGGVHPHERTLLKPKQDRLSTMRAVGGSTGQIFMLYSDPKLVINQALARVTNYRPADIKLKDDDGVIHKLWKVTDPRIIKVVQNTMKKKAVFIADGHHRYETALNYRNEMRALGLKCIGNESFENRMMTFVNMDDKGLTILPTHRLIFGLRSDSGVPTKSGKDFSFNNLLAKLKQYFWINEYPTHTSKEEKASRQEFSEDLRMTGERAHAFGLIVKGVKKYFVLTLKNDKIMDKVITEKQSSTWKRLDVTILHSLILEKMLGINKEQVANEENVNYIRSEDEAIDSVTKGKYQMAFILNPTRIAEVKNVSLKGERMPQKSTDFYPKLLSGIVISKINYLHENETKGSAKGKKARKGCAICSASFR
ncbi:MAG: DUF1015 domain-containing protein [Planctomycetes bacterium]|nr:DUF1015 domain-containing protein [Planctomycetota bacterium]